MEHLSIPPESPLNVSESNITTLRILCQLHLNFQLPHLLQIQANKSQGEFQFLPVFCSFGPFTGIQVMQIEITSPPGGEISFYNLIRNETLGDVLNWIICTRTQRNIGVKL